MRFEDFARAHDLIIEDAYPSDRIRRCPTVDHPKKKNGSYMFDGRRGWIHNWERPGEGVVWWNDENAKPWTEAEKEGWRRRQQAAKERRLQDQEIAAARAKQQIEQARATEHNYFHLKGLGHLTGLVNDGTLLVPMRDWYDNSLLGAQSIWWDEPERKYQKKMTAGMRSKGAVLWLGDRYQSHVWLCEGYATGLSIHEALKSVHLPDAVCVTFSAGNMVYVAEEMRRRRAKLPQLFAFADNDASGVGEQAARDTGAPYAISVNEGWDANDIFRKQGANALVGILMGLRKHYGVQA
jgi:phage/plasmid primase-like uncharacterized protein